MQRTTTVVSETARLSKPQLHAHLMSGWARGIADHGKGGWADKLEITVPALDKQLTGSMPGFEVIDAALDAQPDVLDDYLAAKRKRLVDVDAICDGDDLKVLIARVNLKLQEYAHPDSAAGPAIAHSEYLDGEAMMRELHAASGKWLERCAQIRKPTVVRAA